MVHTYDVSLVYADRVTSSSRLLDSLLSMTAPSGRFSAISDVRIDRGSRVEWSAYGLGLIAWHLACLDRMLCWFKLLLLVIFYLLVSRTRDVQQETMGKNFLGNSHFLGNRRKKFKPWEFPT